MCEVVEGFGVVGVDGEGFLEVVDGVVEFGGGGEGDGEVVVSLGVVGLA